MFITNASSCPSVLTAGLSIVASSPCGFWRSGRAHSRIGHITSGHPKSPSPAWIRNVLWAAFSLNTMRIFLPALLSASLVAVGSRLSGQSPVFIGYPASSSPAEVAGPLGSSMSHRHVCCGSLCLPRAVQTPCASQSALTLWQSPTSHKPSHFLPIHPHRPALCARLRNLSAHSPNFLTPVSHSPLPFTIISLSKFLGLSHSIPIFSLL